MRPDGKPSEDSESTGVFFAGSVGSPDSKPVGSPAVVVDGFFPRNYAASVFSPQIIEEERETAGARRAAVRERECRENEERQDGRSRSQKSEWDVGEDR